MTGFHDVLFPARLAYGSVGGPEMRVDIVQLASGFERRNARIAAPKRRYTISTGQRPMRELRELSTFFEARGGPLNGFRFPDPVDNSTAINGKGISAVDVTLGLGDGTRASFPLQLAHGRPIRTPRSETIKIAIDGEELHSDYAFDLASRELVLDVAPAQGAKLTAGFEYDVPVRFENEFLAITNSAEGAGEVTELNLIEILL